MSIPAAPGTTEIPPTHVRLFHYTGADPEVIRQQGLRIQNAKGENYGEPNQIWASARFPENSLYAGNPVVEFAIPYDDPRWQFARKEKGVKYDPNLEWDDPAQIEAYKQHLESHGSHATFGDDIRPEEIIAVHEPWHSHYRYFVENQLEPDDYQWLKEDDNLPNERRALEEYERTHGQWPRHSQKTARTTMYHVAPMGRREAILEQGLQIGQQSPWGAEPDFDEGIYLWDTPENADLYAQRAMTIGDPDIWRVDVTGLNLSRDPYFETERSKLYNIPEHWQSPAGNVGAFRTFDNIPPERLSLYFENPWHPATELGEDWGEPPERRMFSSEEITPFVGEVWRDLEGNQVKILNLSFDPEERVQVEDQKTKKVYWFPIKDFVAGMTPVEDSWGSKWEPVPEDQAEWNEAFQNMPRAFDTGLFDYARKLLDQGYSREVAISSVTYALNGDEEVAKRIVDEIYGKEFRKDPEPTGELWPDTIPEHWSKWKLAAIEEEEIPDDMLPGYRQQFSGMPMRLAIYGEPFESSHPYFRPYPGLEAFLDLFYNNETVAIAFCNVEPNFEGQGLARQLIQQVYDLFPDREILWGKSMDDRIDHLKEQFRQQFPDRTAEHALPRFEEIGDHPEVWNAKSGDVIEFTGTLYHGTNPPNVENIAEHGFEIDFPQMSDDKVWLVSDPGFAKWYGDAMPVNVHLPEALVLDEGDRWFERRDSNITRYAGRDRTEGRPFFIATTRDPMALAPMYPQTVRASWKYAVNAIPAQYTEQDPLDLQGKQPVFQNMQTEWWTLPEDQQRQAIINAFRATMLSPRLKLRDNAIMYQEFMSIPAEESDPDVFEAHARALKERWDRQGQGDLLGEVEPMGWEKQVPGKLTPGFWTNVRRIAALGPYAETLRKAAIDDLQTNGGKGTKFREKVMSMGIPGVGPKVASFAWLALNPTGSDLGTLDVWMMRHLNQDVESPNNPNHYFELEDQLRDEKDALYGPDTPLGQYQWGVWDKIRTPGLHQDHSPLRVHEPTPYHEVAWGDFKRAPRPQRLPEQAPGQEMLFAKKDRKVEFYAS